MGFGGKLLKEIQKTHQSYMPVSQYEDGEATQADKYQYLNQLLEVYAIIESIVRSQKFKLPVPPAIEALLNRKEEIAIALQSFQRSTPNSYEALVRANATVTYAEHLNKIRIEDEECCEVLLAHLLAQVVADLTEWPQISEHLEKKCEEALASLMVVSQSSDDNNRMKRLMAAIEYSLSSRAKIFKELNSGQPTKLDVCSYGRLFSAQTVAIIGMGALTLIAGAAYALDEKTLSKRW